MKKLTQEAYEYIDQVAGEVVGRRGIKGAQLSEDGDNPFSFFLEIPIASGEELAVRTCNVPEDFWPVTIAIHLGQRIG